MGIENSFPFRAYFSLFFEAFAGSLRDQTKEAPMQEFIPPKPAKSFRIILELTRPEKRLDVVLLAEIKLQNDNLTLREITRTQFKELFKNGKILIKGQKANPSSALAKGTTYIDILGF